VATLVEVLYEESIEVVQYLLEQGEVSYSNTLGSAVPKIVLLAAASYLETEVCRHINEFYGEVTRQQNEAVAFVNNKAISRQYHTFFDWKKGKASPFFGLFGEDVLSYFKVQMMSDVDLAAAVKDFCSLGNLRNQLVHGNYAAFALEKTAQEVFVLYKSTSRFVERIPELIRHPSFASGEGT